MASSLGRMSMLFLAAMAVLQAAQAAPLRPAFWACNPHPDLDFNVTFGTSIPNCCSLSELMREPEPEHKTWEQYLERNPLPREPRVRPAAHLVAGNETYIRQLDLAHRLIRAMPESDPRSQFQQNNFHCMYGVHGVVPQAGAMDIDYSVHSNWLFFPFHRWFTFFYERILAKLVGDDSFALPFWNWDNQSPDFDDWNLPHAIPGFMKDPDRYPGLYHRYRDARHEPGAPTTMVNCIKESVVEGYSAYLAQDMAAQRAINNAHLHKFIVERTANGEREPFLSHTVRAGAVLPQLSEVQGTFEAQAHVAMHFWIGDHANTYADMGISSQAVRDPLFFLHHANVDRIWNVWLGLEGRTNFDDPDFLDAAFYFYDENAEVVKVTVADCLHSDLLGYTYQQVENPWLTYNASQQQQTFPHHSEA